MRRWLLGSSLRIVLGRVGGNAALDLVDLAFCFLSDSCMSDGLIFIVVNFKRRSWYQVSYAPFCTVHQSAAIKPKYMLCVTKSRR